MKILTIHPGASFSVADVHDGLVDGLRQHGHEVGVLNLNDRLSFYAGAHIEAPDGSFVPALEMNMAMRLAGNGILAECYKWWPDVVLVVSGPFVLPEIWGVLARRPHHKVLWCTESPYEDDSQARQARYVDTVIVNDPVNIESLRKVNGRTWYLPQSYDPAKHHPGPVDPDLACDFAFVGTGFPSRIEFFEKVDWTGIRARFGGNWGAVEPGSPLAPMLMHSRNYCIDNAVAADVYRSAKVTANLYRKETSQGGSADGWAIGPREVELAACGAFFMREPRPEGDDLFPMLPTFTTPTEFEDALRWWLAHPAERESAAAEARAAVAPRTFYNSAASLLKLIDGAPTNVR